MKKSSLNKICAPILSLAISVFLVSVAHAAPVQWTVASGGNGHWYDVVGNTTDGFLFTWEDAEARAVAMGGDTHLVTINDAAEQAWVFDTFGPSGFWIGYNDIAIEDTFEWASGETPGYENWNFGEPNNVVNEDGVAMLDNSGLWNDFATIAEFRAVKEWSSVPNPVPLPAALPLLGTGLGIMGFMGWRRRRKANAAA